MGPGTRIGIVGGGQLGRMLILAGRPSGLSFSVLSESQVDPAAQVCDQHIIGDIRDPQAILKLAGHSDVVTVEIEHVSTDGLRLSAAAGVPTHPSGDVLDRVNDKLKQKQLLRAADVPVGPFSETLSGFPTVQKSRRGGYDGRGVAVLRSEDDVPLEGPCYYEELLTVDQELAVTVARSAGGECACYPVVEMEFDRSANICTRVFAPAKTSTSISEKAQRVALRAAEALGAVGLVAVELFLVGDQVLVNELAPRPHNSGHLSIDASETDQFEQHLRAVCGAPLGSTRLVTPAVMQNLLGHPQAHGVPLVTGLDALLGCPGAHLHWYGKEEVRPFRKMGHITVTAEELGEALRRATDLADYTQVASLSK